MQNSYPSLDQLIDLQKWQSLQDHLASVTKLAILTINYKGAPITTHSCPRAFCNTVRSNPELEKYCHKCDSRAGLESVKTNTPFIYKCHFGIIDIAIPISVNDMYLGAVMAGQVHLKDAETPVELEQIFHTTKSEVLATDDDLNALYQSIPSLSYDEITAASSLLFSLCHYIVDEALAKHTAGFRKLNAPLPIKHSHFHTKDYEHSTLGPALDYIIKNKEKNISQLEMSKLCNISSGHFSRLFAKEMGTSFRAYVAKVKIEASKQMLTETDFSITEISDTLGFGDPSYFIKTFKRFETLTPTDYKKYVRR